MFEAISLRTLLILIPALPLSGAILTAIFGPAILRRQSHWPTVLGLAASCICSLMLAVKWQGQLPQDGKAGQGVEEVVTLWEWVGIPQAYAPSPATGLAAIAATENHAPLDFRIDVSLRIDTLTATMLVMVTLISTLVAVYSVGYMHGDEGYWRFFSYLSLFVFSMTMLVTVSNFVMLYVFWEGVGVCSYLLIGFWYRNPAAAAAGKKAFLVNRVGDFGFALALFLMWMTYGSLSFHDTDTVAGVLGARRFAGELSFVGGGVGTAICLLLMAGACGKSAQFPLHVWLPDAMEGPTPVSALIHAATMVTAGVYMIARCMPLFVAAPQAAWVVAWIGAGTALMAGLIALTQFDLKRVLAYSTVSQLGYMFLALGMATLGGVTAGMFHLFTHAFFKALLFLGAGSVMHAMGNVIDMRRFGGLRHRLPITHATFAIGCLALAGIFPLSGFWSKDAILAAVHDQAHATGASSYRVLYGMAMGTAFLTAFYTFRAFFMTFYGPQRIPEEAGHHAHESPKVMWIPLVVLALFAALVGPMLEWTHAFAHWLQYTPSLAMMAQAAGATGAPAAFHWDVAVTSTAVAVAGVALAAFLYLGHRREVAALQYVFRFGWMNPSEAPSDWESASPHAAAVANVTRPGGHPTVTGHCPSDHPSGSHGHEHGPGLLALPARLLKAVGCGLWSLLTLPLWLGQFVSPYQMSHSKFFVDEIYDVLIVGPLRGLAHISYVLDRVLVDGLVNGVGGLPVRLGGWLRKSQRGFVSLYGLLTVVGMVLVVVVSFWWGV